MTFAAALADCRVQAAHSASCLRAFTTSTKMLNMALELTPLTFSIVMDC